VFGRCRYGSLRMKVMLLAEQGQGSCLLKVEELREGQARCIYVVLTIGSVSKKLAPELDLLYHALIIAGNPICKHSVAKLIKAICRVAFRALLEQVRQIRVHSHLGEITAPPADWNLSDRGNANCKVIDIDGAPNRTASKVTRNIVVRARHGYPGEYLTRDVIFYTLFTFHFHRHLDYSLSLIQTCPNHLDRAERTCQCSEGSRQSPLHALGHQYRVCQHG